jgi:methionyl aminopeptidase
VAADYPDVMAVRTALRPGVVSPTLPVPRSIARPEYVGKATAQEGSEPWVQTPEVIEKMRVAGRIAANALAEAGKAVAPGVTTDELDRIAHEYMIDHGALPTRRASTTVPSARAQGAIPHAPASRPARSAPMPWRSHR